MFAFAIFCILVVGFCLMMALCYLMDDELWSALGTTLLCIILLFCVYKSCSGPKHKKKEEPKVIQDTTVQNKYIFPDLQVQILKAELIKCEGQWGIHTYSEQRIREADSLLTIYKAQADSLAK